MNSLKYIVETIGYSREKNIKLIPASYYSLNKFQMDQRAKCKKTKAIKLLKENIGEFVYNPGVGKAFFSKT